MAKTEIKYAHLVMIEEPQVLQNCPPISKRPMGLVHVLMNKSQYTLTAETSAAFKLKKRKWHYSCNPLLSFSFGCGNYWPP